MLLGPHLLLVGPLTCVGASEELHVQLLMTHVTPYSAAAQAAVFAWYCWLLNAGMACPTQSRSQSAASKPFQLYNCGPAAIYFWCIQPFFAKQLLTPLLNCQYIQAGGCTKP